MIVVEGRANRDWARLLVWAAVVLAIGLIPLAVGWSHLPDPVASHWGISGAPNGSMARVFSPAIMIGMVLLGLAVAYLFRVDGGPTAEAYVMVGLFGGIGLAIDLTMVQLNWGVPTWEAARSFTWWHLGLVFVLAFLGGAAGFALGKRFHPQAPPGPSDRPTIVLAPGQSVAWHAAATVRWPLVLTGVGLILLLVLSGPLAWLALPLIIVSLPLMHVAVSVEDDWVRVRLGGIPVRRIAISTVSSARPIELEPTEWGGWGWRVSPGASAIVLRRGPALEITFATGRRFAVTVDAPATGAALINGLLSRLAGTV
jgi:Domain of unknown function (DUF1648)